MVKPTISQQLVVAQVALARLPRSEPPAKSGERSASLTPAETEAVALWLKGLGFEARFVPGVAITVSADPETFESRFQCKVRKYQGYWEYEREPVLPIRPQPNLPLQITGVHLQHPVVARVALVRADDTRTPSRQVSEDPPPPTAGEKEQVASWLEGLGFDVWVTLGTSITIAADLDTFEEALRCKVRLEGGYWEYER